LAKPELLAVTFSLLVHAYLRIVGRWHGIDGAHVARHFSTRLEIFFAVRRSDEIEYAQFTTHGSLGQFKVHSCPTGLVAIEKG
jgi:hypothetical protein